MHIIKCIVFSVPQVVEGVQYHPANAPWPKTEVIKTMPFDYTIHDAKYDDTSIIYCPGFKPRADGKKSGKNVHLQNETTNMKFLVFSLILLPS